MHLSLKEKLLSWTAATNKQNGRTNTIIIIKKIYEHSLQFKCITETEDVPHQMSDVSVALADSACKQPAKFQKMPWI